MKCCAVARLPGRKVHRTLARRRSAAVTFNERLSRTNTDTGDPQDDKDNKDARVNKTRGPVKPGRRSGRPKTRIEDTDTKDTQNDKDNEDVRVNETRGTRKARRIRETRETKDTDQGHRRTGRTRRTRRTRQIRETKDGAISIDEDAITDALSSLPLRGLCPARLAS